MTHLCAVFSMYRSWGCCGVVATVVDGIIRRCALLLSVVVLNETTATRNVAVVSCWSVVIYLCDRDIAQVLFPI